MVSVGAGVRMKAMGTGVRRVPKEEKVTKERPEYLIWDLGYFEH